MKPLCVFSKVGLCVFGNASFYCTISDAARPSAHLRTAVRDLTPAHTFDLRQKCLFHMLNNSLQKFFALHRKHQRLCTANSSEVKRLSLLNLEADLSVL